MQLLDPKSLYCSDTDFQKRLSVRINKYDYHVIQICSGITSGRVLDVELLYTKIPEVIGEKSS